MSKVIAVPNKDVAAYSAFFDFKRHLEIITISSWERLKAKVLEFAPKAVGFLTELEDSSYRAGLREAFDTYMFIYREPPRSFWEFAQNSMHLPAKLSHVPQELLKVMAPLKSFGEKAEKVFPDIDLFNSFLPRAFTLIS